MSKATGNAKQGRQQERTPGFDRGQFAEVTALMNSADLSNGPATLPVKVNEAVLQLVNDTVTLIPHMPELGLLSERGLSWIAGMLHYCTSQGFSMALYRYADELQAVPELSAWNKKRAAGAERGRVVQQTKKADRIARIQSMLNSGMEPNAIAAQLGCSISTVYRALEPANSKPRKASKRSRKR